MKEVRETERWHNCEGWLHDACSGLSTNYAFIDLGPRVLANTANTDN